MAKFQVIKQSQREGIGKNQKQWVMEIIKGLFTDDEGEVEMYEIVSFLQDGVPSVTYSPGETCTPCISVRKNKDTGKPELHITSLKRIAASAVKSA